MTRRPTLAALAATAAPAVRAQLVARRPTGAPDAGTPRTVPLDASAVHHRRSTPAADGVVVVEVPGLRLVSEANQRAGAHWAKSHRTSAARSAVARALRGRTLPRLPLRVCITRLAPGTLDDDNAASACKASRDSIAAVLGVDDADPRVTWRVAQERTKRGVYGVRVTLAPVDGRASVVAGDAADVVRLRLTAGEVRAMADALDRGSARVECGGVVLELTTEAGR